MAYFLSSGVEKPDADAILTAWQQDEVELDSLVTVLK